MKKLITILFFASTCSLKVNAQTIPDTVLTLNNFIEKIKQHHPLAKVAALQVDKAKANLLIAKGGFDPIFEYESSNKTFDSKNYYYHNEAFLKVPLPIGDIKTGIENNGGQFLESEITKGKSSYLGIEVPIAKGLMIDKRRAFLKQANIALSQNEVQRKSLMNDLLLDAYLSYYQWAAAYKLFNVYNNYVAISSDRLKLVKTLYINGDKAPMDTMEALSQLQNFKLLQNEAAINLKTSALMINNFLWDGNGVAQNVKENITPEISVLNENITTTTIVDALNISSTQNPALQQYIFKIKSLEVDKKLKFQNVLPTVNLKANLLNQDYFALKNTGFSLLDNNNKWGINIKIPLLFREGRGEYKLAKLKIEETLQEQKQKQQEINNKVKDYYNQFITLEVQIKTANNIQQNYNNLLKNEMLRFSNGESSLFLVNSRENKLLESEQKIIDLQFKLLKAKLTLDWIVGIIQ